MILSNNHGLNYISDFGNLLIADKWLLPETKLYDVPRCIAVIVDVITLVVVVRMVDCQPTSP